jgi:peptidoglycan/LPS O-acetylase OafA/YrhL
METVTKIGERTRLHELDGLRTLAIAGVLGIHADGSRVPGGHLGVSVFFVLSGFLITSMLLRERDTHGRVEFMRFYVKRAARLLPALILVLAVVAPLMFLVEPRGYVWLGVLSAFFYISNVVAWLYGADVLAHFEWAWTLSLEEQFYLLWPALLVTALRRRTVAICILGGAILISEGLRMAMPIDGSPPGIYFAPQTRMSGLLLGALLAYIPMSAFRRIPVWCADAIALVATLTIGAAFVTAGLASRSTYTVWLPAVEIASAVLVAVLVSTRSRFRIAFGWRPIAYLGLISYGVYLWNVPVTLFLQSAGIQSLLVRACAGTALTILLAAISFKYVEVPVSTWIRALYGKAAGRRQPRTKV